MWLLNQNTTALDVISMYKYSGDESRWWSRSNLDLNLALLINENLDIWS